MSFKQVMPGITSLRNPYLKPRHWEEIEKLIGRAIDRDKSFTLGNLLEMNVRVFLVRLACKSSNSVYVDSSLPVPNNDLDPYGCVGHDCACVKMPSV